MGNRKDIGKIFREKIDLLEKDPNNDGWNAIQSELDKKKKRKLIFIPFWFKSIGLLTAGSFCLWLITNSSFENEIYFGIDINSNDSKLNNIHPNSKNTNSIVLQNSTKSKTDTITITNRAVATDSSISSKIKLINKKTAAKNSDNVALTSLKVHSNNITHNKRKKSANNEKSKLTTKSNNSLNKKSKTKSHKTKITNQSFEKPIKNSKNINSSKSSNTTLNLETAIVANTVQIENENKITEISSEKENKKVILKTAEKDTITSPEIKKESFELFVYGSPTISGFSKNKSLLDNRLNNNPTSSDVTFSYGAYFCYQGTANFSLRIGLGITNLNLTTNNTPINTQNYSNISYSPGISNSYIYNQSNNSEYMKIVQEISYVEIPLEAKYRLIHHEFGINAIMGVNYLFLNNNEVSAITDNGSKFKIGKTTDLLDRTLGINIGLGFDYNLTKKIKLNVEPMFKYHFKNSQNNDETKLFSLNILTGVQIKFGK
jgi:hypothetical protein